ncbi:hypothetical protein DIU36_24650 [Mucilaginibacter rubeus]|nr:hypothetical protein DIU36_24650 [Mucilaginibacter rubeus]
MAELIKMEHMADMDVNFKNPQANMFAGRIAKDAQAIQTHLLSNPRVQLKVTDPEFVEDYAGELYRVFHYFIGLPLSQVKEVMDNLQSLSVIEE